MVLGVAYVGTRYYAAADAAIAPRDLSYRLAIGEQTIRGQGAVAELPVLKAREGDHINLLVTSALPAELYIHGLEISTTLPADLETSLAFPAKYSGRYYVHLHNVICAPPHESDESHVEVAVIEVEPR
jgi:hypothetical protein